MNMRNIALMLFAAAIAGILGGCESFGAPRMTPEQLQAAAKDRNASVGCGSYDSLVVDGAVMIVNIDEKVVKNGSLEVKCGANSVSFTNSNGIMLVPAPQVRPMFAPAQESGT